MPSSSVARQLAAAPMMILPIRIEHALNMAVQGSYDTDPREHRWPSRNSATGIRLSIAACRRLVARCHARAERTARDLRRRFNFGCTRLQFAAALLDEASADCMLCLFSKEKMGEGRLGAATTPTSKMVHAALLLLMLEAVTTTEADQQQL